MSIQCREWEINQENAARAGLRPQNKSGVETGRFGSDWWKGSVDDDNVEDGGKGEERRKEGGRTGAIRPPPLHT